MKNVFYCLPLLSRQLIQSLILLLSLLSNHHVFANTSDKIYSLGVIPQFESDRLNDIWQPIIEHLQTQTGFQFSLQGSPSIPAFEKKIMAGEFDFAYINPYQLLKSQKTAAYQPLIRDLKRKLYGVLVVHKDSGIDRVQQLNNANIAFPSPNALGASLLLRAEIAQDYNINFMPRYVNTHNSVYLNVFLKQTLAGGGVQKTLDQQKDIIKNNLKTIYETQKVTPHPFVSHPRIPQKIQQRISRAFIKLNNTVEGRKLLLQIPIKKAGTATLDDYANLNKLNLEKFYLEK